MKYIIEDEREDGGEGDGDWVEKDQIVNVVRGVVGRKQWVRQ